MKVLVINGMGAIPGNPASVCFITERIKSLSSKSIETRILNIILINPGFIRIIKKIVGIKLFQYPESVVFDNVTYEFVPVKITLTDYTKILLMNKSAISSMVDEIQSYIHGSQYDLVLAHVAYPYGEVANEIGKKLGIPSVITAHGSEIHTYPINNSKLLQPTIKALEGACQVIFVSSALRNKAIELGYSGDNSVVIPNGIDINKFAPMEKNVIKENLNINTKCVGFVGNLKHVKRADALPKIFNEIKRQYPKITFLVVGDGDLRKKVEKGVMDYGLDVRFTGIVDPIQVPYYMNAMDVILLPSRNEGYGCVVVEAQACGIPVVGSSNGGIPEAIGDGGIVVPEGGFFEKRFADATVSLLKSNINKEGLINRAKQLSWSNVINAEIKVYESVISLHNRS